VNERSVVIVVDEGCAPVVEITGDYTAHERILIDRALRKAWKFNLRERYQRMNRDKELARVAEKAKVEKGKTNAENRVERHAE